MRRRILALTLALSGTPTLAADKENLALQLVAVATFVQENCQGLEPNMVMMSAALEAMGVSVDALKKDNRLLQGNLIVLSLKKNVKANCKDAVSMFGPSGSVLPGIIEKE